MGKVGAGAVSAGEAGAGSVLTVAVLAAVLAVALMVGPLIGAVVDARVAANAADAAALAAADTVIGIIPGDPCGNASRTATAGGAELVNCTIEGLVATVEVRRTGRVIATTVRARAGPRG